jgi:hypothetical protein
VIDTGIRKKPYVRHVKVRTPTAIDERAFAPRLRQAARWRPES